MISQISNDQSNNRPDQDNLSPLVLWMTKMKIDLIKFGLKTWQLLSYIPPFREKQPVTTVMEPSDIDLVRICAVAFAAVLAILSLLAMVIASICRAFPVKASDMPNPSAEEAVRQAVAETFPGCRIAEIREIKT